MSVNIVDPKRLKKIDNIQPVMNVLTQSPLKHIIQKARYLLALDAFIQPILPPEFAKQCSVMNFQNGTVILRTNNAAVATRLRFESADILQKLRAEKQFANVRMLQFKVRPSASD